MKVFISGQIRGMPEYNKPAFDRAEKLLTEQGYAVMNPIKLHPAYPEQFDHADYMHVCKAMIDICDKVYFLKGWQFSDGSNQEFRYAIKWQKECEWEASE